MPIFHKDQGITISRAEMPLEAHTAEDTFVIPLYLRMLLGIEGES